MKYRYVQQANLLLLLLVLFVVDDADVALGSRERFACMLMLLILLLLLLLLIGEVLPVVFWLWCFFYCHGCFEATTTVPCCLVLCCWSATATSIVGTPVDSYIRCIQNYIQHYVRCFVSDQTR